MKTLRLRIVVIFALAFIGASVAMLWISALVSNRFDVDFFEGSILALAIVTGLLGWALSLAIFSPLKRVSTAVDCFGKGDLSARVVCDRKDEIGDLARSFNAMADRLQTLLTAERRLLQDVSHELRSPLSRLSFAVELMKNTEDRDAAAGRVRREIDRLSHLVSTLLEMSSSEADLSSREVQDVAMNSLTEAIVADCSFEAGFRGVRVETQMRSCAVVAGDSELLGRAIENVVRNAIRFSPPGSPVLVSVDDKDSAVEIRVRDYGPGVPKDLLTQIFDPFFRVDESRDSAAGGIGFGLSIARRAVRLHRGEITATNAIPGLEVSITIPALT